MNKKILIVLSTISALSAVGWAGSSLAQDSNIPDSVRAIIEANMAATQFDQTARVQLGIQFGDFLSGLAGSPQRRRDVEASFMEVFKERAELSSKVLSGQARTSELSAISGYEYLRANVASSLNTEELEILDSLAGGPSDDQLKREYAGELSRMASGLSDANSTLVLDTLVKYIRAGNDAVVEGRLSVDELVDQQGRAFIQAQEELQSQITGEQWLLVTGFFNQLRANLYMNRNMSETNQ